jgi:uncharacterized protein (TIGR02270 family)
MTLPARPILWSIFEEHLSEAAWLWGEWEQSLDSPLYAITDVAIGPEERLLAHLDGLVLGGAPVARKLLLPLLGSEDQGEVAAAAWALLQAEDADHQDAVVAALGQAPPPAQAAIGRAIWLSPAADISRLLPLWNDGSPAVQAMILDLFAPREPQWVRERLDPALRSGQPSLVAAALRAVRRARDREFGDHVRFALADPRPEVQREVMPTGLALGLKETWSLCRAVAAAPGENCRLALGLLAIGPDPKDRDYVRGRAADPEAGRHAIWALGFCADVKAVDALVEAMANPEIAKLAGEAFTAITGVALAGPLATPGETAGPDVEEVSLDAPPPVVRPEDHLPEPRVEAVAKWWKGERPRYHPVVRYIHGQPRNTEALRPALASVATWRREVLATELTISLVSAPRVELRDFARNQLRQLAQMPKPVLVDRKLLAMHQQTLR